MSGPGNSNSKGEKTSEKDITYEGYLNDNYFKLISRETEHINNIEISHAIVRHPISGEINKYIGLLLKSKYDGVGIKEQIDISIGVDISKSMGNYNSQEVSNEIIKSIVNQMSNNYSISITTFNLKSKVVTPMKTKKETDLDLIDKMKNIQCRGSTDFELGLKGACEQLEKSTSKNKRIIIITDGKLLEKQENEFKEMFKKVIVKNIEITIVNTFSTFNKQ